MLSVGAAGKSRQQPETRTTVRAEQSDNRLDTKPTWREWARGGLVIYTYQQKSFLTRAQTKVAQMPFSFQRQTASNGVSAISKARTSFLS